MADDTTTTTTTTVAPTANYDKVTELANKFNKEFYADSDEVYESKDFLNSLKVLIPQLIATTPLMANDTDVDLNTVKEASILALGTSNANAPVFPEGNGIVFLLTIPGDSAITQLAYNISNADKGFAGSVMARSCTKGVWASWVDYSVKLRQQSEALRGEAGTWIKDAITQLNNQDLSQTADINQVKKDYVKIGVQTPPAANTIPTGADLDTYTTQGFYYCPMDDTAATLKNSPVKNAFGMLVIPNAGVTQLIFDYMPNLSAGIYKRNVYGTGNKSDWSQVSQPDHDTTVTGQYKFKTPLQVVMGSDGAQGVLQMDLGKGNHNVVTGLASGVNSGDGVMLGAGGLTIVGSGEAPTNIANQLATKTLPTNITAISSAGDEKTLVASDDDVRIITNYQSGGNDAHEYRFGANGILYLADGGIAASQTYVNVINSVRDQGEVGRGTNNLPSYYMDNYPMGTVKEFKYSEKLGITLPSTEATSGTGWDYCILTTTVPSTHAEYGFGRQTVEMTKTNRPLTFVRIASSASSWSPWEQVISIA